MRNLIVIPAILFLVLQGAALFVQARDFRILSDRELAGTESGSTSVSESDQKDPEPESEDQRQNSAAETGREFESPDQHKKFPNPFIMGRGYENQGVNMAVFSESPGTRRTETDAEDRDE